MDFLNILPHETVEKIFGNLRPQDIKNAVLVCRWGLVNQAENLSQTVSVMLTTIHR